MTLYELVKRNPNLINLDQQLRITEYKTDIILYTGKLRAVPLENLVMVVNGVQFKNYNYPVVYVVK